MFGAQGSTARGAARMAPDAVNFPARLRLEPLFLAGNVDSLEFFIGLGQVDNPFHQPKYASRHQSNIANPVQQLPNEEANAENPQSYKYISHNQSQHHAAAANCQLYHCGRLMPR